MSAKVRSAEENGERERERYVQLCVLCALSRRCGLDKCGKKNLIMDYQIPTGTRIGHVHLKVADLHRALGFYRDLLGFELQQFYGENAAFISAGGYHHHIGLNTWYSKNGPPAPRHAAGLFHTAILYPTRKDLAIVVKRLILAKYPLTGASDHGVSEAIYLDDPDGNGVELYWDRPKDQWPTDEKGNIQMVTEPLALDELLKLAD
jgi:catechol 2,3-dioxygenase